MKRVIVILTVLSFLLINTGCSNQKESVNETTTTDIISESTSSDANSGIDMDKFAIIIVKEACQARWDKMLETEKDYEDVENSIKYNYKKDKYEGDFDKLKELYTTYNQAEYDVICKYTSDNFINTNFKSDKVKKEMISYAETLEKQLEIGKTTDFSNIEENEKYIQYANQKIDCVQIFFDDYDLKFDVKYEKIISEYYDTK